MFTNYVLSAAERVLLENACRQADLISHLEAQVALDGLMVTGSTGHPRPHPAAAALGPARASLTKLIRDLGLPQLDYGDSEPEPEKTPERMSRSAQASKAARTLGKGATVSLVSRGVLTRNS